MDDAVALYVPSWTPERDAVQVVDDGPGGLAGPHPGVDVQVAGIV
jgi:hypothetical protein